MTSSTPDRDSYPTGAVEYSDLPDVSDAPDSPIVELERLATRNRERLGELANRGAVINDAHPLISAFLQNELLEAILRRVTTEEDATDVLLGAQVRLSELLDQSEAGVNRAILAAPAQGQPMNPANNGLPSRRFRRGG